MDFIELCRANESIKTTDIKGKAYAEVNQRIKAFRMICPDGFIHTEIEFLEHGVCLARARVGEFIFGDAGRQELVYGTGTAYEKEGSTFINKTSYIENAETSAVGRALGMMGIGVDTSVASYEEVANAVENQKTISEKEVAILKNTLTDNQIEWAVKRYGKPVEKLSKVEYGDIMRQINERTTNEG